MTSSDRDELIEDIRGRRHAHAEALDFDLERITADLQREERESGVIVVSRVPRRPPVLPKRSSA